MGQVEVCSRAMGYSNRAGVWHTSTAGWLLTHGSSSVLRAAGMRPGATHTAQQLAGVRWACSAQQPQGSHGAPPTTLPPLPTRP